MSSSFDSSGCEDLADRLLPSVRGEEIDVEVAQHVARCATCRRVLHQRQVHADQLRALALPRQGVARQGVARQGVARQGVARQGVALGESRELDFRATLQAVESRDRVRALVRALPRRAAPAGLWQGVLSRIADPATQVPEIPAPRVGAGLRSWLAVRSPRLAAAAMVVLMFGAVWYLRSSSLPAAWPQSRLGDPLVARDAPLTFFSNGANPGAEVSVDDWTGADLRIRREQGP